MDHEMEMEMFPSYNYTELVSTGPDLSRQIALDQAIKLSIAHEISADSVETFAERFRVFLDPLETEAV